MPEILFSDTEDLVSVEVKVLIEDDGIPGIRGRAPEYVDFSDYLGATSGKNLLVSLQSLSTSIEKAGGVSFQSSISSISWANPDGFWNKPFPLGSGTVYGFSRPTEMLTINGNTAYFSVSKLGTVPRLFGNKLKVTTKSLLRDGSLIELDRAIFFVGSIRRESAGTVSMKVTSLAQPLLKNKADTIKNSNGWWENKNPAFLIRQILLDQYKVSDLGDTSLDEKLTVSSGSSIQIPYNPNGQTPGNLPDNFNIPQVIRTPTDAWIQELEWLEDNPGETYIGEEPRTISQYGRPPEWDGKIFRDDKLVTRAMGIYQIATGTVTSSGPGATILNFSSGVDLKPTGGMGPLAGDSIVIRESTKGNDGSYVIEEIISSRRIRIVGGLNGAAESGMKFSITVILMGCDNELWFYNPESETYKKVNRGGAKTDNNTQWRQIVLNRNNRFICIAWSVPSYEENSNIAAWNHELTTSAVVGVLYRNTTEGEIFYYRTFNFETSGEEIFSGELLLREMQWNYWVGRGYDYAGQQGNLRIGNRQAGIILDIENDPVFTSYSLNDDRRTYDESSGNSRLPGAWLSNRGIGIILPYPQRIWLVTGKRSGFLPQSLITYRYFYASRKVRKLRWPFDNPIVKETPDTIEKYTPYSFIHPVALAKELSEPSLGGLDWWAPENNLADSNIVLGGTAFRQTENNEFILAYRRGFDLETDKNRASLDGPYFFDKASIMPAGTYLVKTADTARLESLGLKDNGEGRLFGVHNWGTKGGIEFVDTTKALNGVVIFPVMNKDSTGVYFRYAAIGDSTVAALATISSTISSGETYNPHADSLLAADNAQTLPRPISCCVDTDNGIYYSLYFNYAWEGPATIAKSFQHPLRHGYAYIVKYDVQSVSVASATATRIYTGVADTSYADQGIPVEIYYNPDESGYPLLVLVQDNEKVSAPGHFRFYKHAATANNALTSLGDKAVLSHRPASMVYDANGRYWYGVLNGPGSLFKMAITGQDAYIPQILDAGWPIGEDQGYSILRQLVMDPYTRKSPPTGDENLRQRILWPNWPPIVTQGPWNIEFGAASNFLIGGNELQITKASGKAGISYTGSSSNVEYEAIFSMMINQVQGAGLPYSDTFTTNPLGTTFRRVKATRTTSGNSVSGFSSYTSAQFTWSSGQLEYTPTFGDLNDEVWMVGDQNAWDISEYIVTLNIPASTRDYISASVFIQFRDGGDLSGSGDQFIGIHLTRRTASSNWTLQREIRFGFPQFYNPYSWSGGPTELEGIDLKIKITKSGTTHTVYVDEGGGYISRDSFYEDRFQTGGVAIGGACTVNGTNAILFKDISVAGATEEGAKAVFYLSDDGSAADNDRVEFSPGEKKVSVYTGGSFQGAMIVPELEFGIRFPVRIRRNINTDGLINVMVGLGDSGETSFSVSDTSTANQQFGIGVEDAKATFSWIQIWHYDELPIDVDSRTILYGIASPVFSPEWGRDADQANVQWKTEYILWKYDVYYSNRIPLADFGGMTQWEALQQLALLTNHMMAFDLDAFIFVPKIPNSDDTVHFRDEDLEDGLANLISLGYDDGEDEVYNHVVITPSYLIKKEPNITLTLLNRSPIDLEKAQLEPFVDQRDTRGFNIRLVCVRSGYLGGVSYADSPQFIYSISGRQIETHLTQRKLNNGAPFELLVADDMSEVSEDDEITITVESGGKTVTLTAKVERVDSSDYGDLITLKDRFEDNDYFPSNGLPVGTTINVNLNSGWSNTLSSGPRFWPYAEVTERDFTPSELFNNPELALGAIPLKSGKFYRVGNTEIYVKINDGLYESELRALETYVALPFGEGTKQKQLYQAGLKSLTEIREGDVIEIHSEGATLEANESFAQTAYNVSSIEEHGKRDWPSADIKFASPRQARDLTRRIIREYAWPKPIYTITVGYNPQITFLDNNGKLRRYTVQSRVEFPLSDNYQRKTRPRSIVNNPLNHKTVITLKDVDPA